MRPWGRAKPAARGCQIQRVPLSIETYCARPRWNVSLECFVAGNAGGRGFTPRRPVYQCVPMWPRCATAGEGWPPTVVHARPAVNLQAPGELPPQGRPALRRDAAISSTPVAGGAARHRVGTMEAPQGPGEPATSWATPLRDHPVSYAGGVRGDRRNSSGAGRRLARRP